MELSRFIKNKIRDWEACSLKAYKCPAGIYTIGYGHTGPEVKEGMVITKVQAESYFEADIKKFAASVEKLFTGVALNNNQFDSLVSLSFNIGSIKTKAPTLFGMVKKNPSDPNIYGEFLKHVNARVNGALKKLPGLVTRRTLEADHYFGRV